MTFWALFDPTITWGTVFGAANLAVMIIAGVAAYSIFKTRVEINLKQLAEVADALKIAQKEQLRDHEHVIERLEQTQRLHESNDERMFREIASKIADLAGGVQRIIGQNEVFRSIHGDRK